MSETTLCEKPTRVKLTEAERRAKKAEQDRRYYDKNREKVKAKVKEWALKNKEKIVDQCRAYYLKNKGRLLKKAQQYAIQNKSKVVEYKRKWKNKNRELVKVRHKEWKKANRERYKIQQREWYERNKEQAKQASVKWAKTPSGKASFANSAHRRRALKAKTTSESIADEIKRLLKLAKACYYCERPFSKTLKPTIDHILPLNKGGSHTIDNLCLACKSCNSKKNAKHPEEWAKQIGRLLI